MLWAIGSRLARSQPVFISGSPRSGTTWVLEVLEHMLLARRHYEPIAGFGHELRKRGCRNFEWRMHIATGEEYPEIRGLIEAMLVRDRIPAELTRVYSPRLGRFGSAIRLLRGNLTLVKFTEAQRLLPWIARTFESRGVVLLRNPLSIVASIKAFSESHSSKRMTDEIRLELPPYVTALFPRLAGFHGTTVSRLTALAIDVCVDLMLPVLDRQCRHRFVFATYEALVLDGSRFNDVIHALGLADFCRHEVPENRPSATAFGDSNVLVSADPNQSWRHRLSEDEVETVWSIVTAVGMDFYRRSGEVRNERLVSRGFDAVIV